MSNGLRYLLEKYELVWNKDDIKRFREAWNCGMTIRQMAKYMRTSETEIVLLGIDQFGLYIVKERLTKE